MAQVSRPFQIGIAAVAVLACVWLFALRGHSSGNEASSSPPSSPPASASSQPAGSSTSRTHSSVPGLEGLTKDVQKAHGAVAASERNAAALDKRSQEVTDADGGGSSSASTPTHGASSASGTATKTATTRPSTSKSSTVPSATPAAVAQRNSAIEARLGSGGVALILFWNPKGTEDVSVHNVLQRLPAAKVSVFDASPHEVASFGTLTKSVQIYQTPTLLVIGPDRKAHVITGLTDAYAVQQIIAEALKPSA
jgi:hypothetical protein